jgi:hypothetical protein
LDAVAPALVQGRRVAASGTANAVTVTVDGTALTPVPGVTFSLHATSTQILEKFRPDS